MNQTSPMDRVKTITTEKFIVNITQCSIIKIKLIKKVQQTGLHWNFQLTIQLFSKLWRLTWKKVHWERGWEIKQFENMVMTIALVWINACWVRINLPLLSKIKPLDFRLPKKHFGDVMTEVLLNVSNNLLDCNISQYDVAKSTEIT